MLGQMMSAPLLVSNQIEFAARFHASVEVVTRTVEGPVVRATWGDVARRSRKLAHALLKLGIKQGDRVATIAWNTQRHLELYFAVSGIGAVLHTINPRLPPDQLRYVVEHAEDETLFFDTTFLKLAQFLSAQGNKLSRYVALTDAAHLPSDCNLPNLANYEDLIAPESDSFAWPLLDENLASSLCYTSGTAGHPKGVLYSHRSTVLHSYAAAMADSLAISSRDVTLPVVPMFHVNAWGVPYAAAIELENAAMGHPGVAIAAAVGVPHPKWQERPLLVVVKAKGSEVTKEELLTFLETKVVKWWLPDSIEFVDALPVGATGKVLKRELRKRFNGHSGG